MSKNEKMSKEEWMQKAGWEGGILEALDYGLSEKDLSEKDDPVFYNTIKKANKQYRELLELIEDVDLELEDYLE